MYAKKYGHILQTRDASPLLRMTPKNRQHAMRSCAALARYMGIHPEWQQIKERYGLKWTAVDSLQYFRLMTDGKHDYDTMIKWLKETCHSIPKSYANILLFSTLTGLRCQESCDSINLIKTEQDNYVNREKMVLEHLKYPEIFISKTKRAYISVVDESILELAKEAENCGHNALRLMIKRRGLDMNMRACRKIHATYLRNQGIEAEVIDMLQGRVPTTVFGRHYYRFSTETEFHRVRKTIKLLRKELEV